MTTTNFSELSELKKRAIIAKQRLKMGYWQAISQERSKKINEAGKDNSSIQIVRELQREQVKRDISLTLGSISILAEEALYKKVCELLESSEVITNPIGKLVDEKVYSNLDEGNRQKYILDLSKKFCELKNRYFKEQELKKLTTL